MSKAWRKLLKDFLWFLIFAAIVAYLSGEAMAFLDKHYAGNTPYWIRRLLAAMGMIVGALGCLYLTKDSYRAVQNEASRRKEQSRRAK